MNVNEYGIKNEAPAIIGKVPKQYPWLCEDRHCDVCVAGGGMTGAMCALAAAEMGLSVVLITSGGIGFGDTGHMTGCARFDAGRPLAELDRIMKCDDALKLYSMAFEALDGLENLCGRLDGKFKNTGISSGFARRDLLVYSTDQTDLELMEREYISIRKAFPQCALISRRTAEGSFEFPVSGGILTAEGSAVFDPFALAHLCMMNAEELGAEIYEQTEAIDIQTPTAEEGCVVIKTSTFRTVYADRLIFAAGSDGMKLLPYRGYGHTLFDVAGLLTDKGAGWTGKCTLGSYGRTNVNCGISSRGHFFASRVCRSGKLRRIFKAADEESKYAELSNYIKNVLPEPDAAKLVYNYSHSFFSPADGLPVIGKHDAYKNCVFALPGLFRDSGAPIFSLIAAKTAAKMLENNKYENNSLFDPMRL